MIYDYQVTLAFNPQIYNKLVIMMREYREKADVFSVTSKDFGRTITVCACFRDNDFLIGFFEGITLSAEHYILEVSTR